MPNRIPHTNQEIIHGQEATARYLRMQKVLGRFYLQNFFKALARQNKRGRFLEIGPGPGYQTAIVAEQYPDVKIVALEPSADMIAVAGDYLTRRGLGGRVRLLQGAVEDRALIDGLGKFDLIYSTFSLHHWPDPVQAFRNLYGALKPAGVLLIYDFERGWLASRLPLSQGMVASIRAAYTTQEIQAMLIQAQIDEFTIHPSFPFLSIEVAKREYLPTLAQSAAQDTGIDSLSEAREAVKPLHTLAQGEAGPIVAIKTNKPERTRELTAMGISLNGMVRMTHNYVRYVIFKVDGREFAADREIASEIAVRVIR